MLLAAPALVARAAELAMALEKSQFVYVSPLKSDGNESTCHGEVWFAWLDGSVVLITRTNRWKARAVAKGLDKARLWVGDYGRWKNKLGKTNDAFRQGPHFDAKVENVKDDALLDRLLAEYTRKYPDQISKWGDQMRKEYHDGSRVMLRYTPV